MKTFVIHCYGYTLKSFIGLIGDIQELHYQNELFNQQIDKTQRSSEQVVAGIRDLYMPIEKELFKRRNIYRGTIGDNQFAEDNL